MIGAIDIGGTKTLVAVFNDKGKLTEQERFETSQNYEDFLKDLEVVVDKLTTKDFKKAAVAIPGVVDRENGVGIRFGNLPWRDVPIQANFEKLFGCPIIVDNDAKAAGFYEAKNIIKEFKKVLYVTIGTGIGLAYVFNGKIDPVFGDRGGNQFIVDHNGEPEAWESFASGKAIVRRFGKKASEITDDATWKIIAHDLSIGIWTIVALVEPEVIVIGGGVGSHFDRFDKLLKAELNRYATPVLKVPVIKQASKPEEAVIYGCYEMAKAKSSVHAKHR